MDDVLTIYNIEARIEHERRKAEERKQQSKSQAAKRPSRGRRR